MYLCITVFGLLLVSAVEGVFAQGPDTIRMMQYNLMYYTNTSGISDCNTLSNNLDSKDANIKTIFQYVKPTVMCVCEIGSQNQYADRLLNNAIPMALITIVADRSPTSRAEPSPT